MALLKNCSNCRQTKPVTEFNRGLTRADGYQNMCKECSRDYSYAHRHLRPILQGAC